MQDYFQNFRSKVKVVGHRKIKNGEFNINNFLYLTFGSVTYNFQDLPGSKFAPPFENENLYKWDMRPARLCNPSDCSCCIDVL